MHLEGKDLGQALSFIRKQAGLPNDWKPGTEEGFQGLPDTAIPMMEVPPDHQSWENLRKRGLVHLAEKISIEVTGKYSGRFILPCTYFGEVRGFEAKTYCNQFTKALYPTWFKTYAEVYTTNDWDWSCESAIVTESIFDAETFGQNAIGLYGSKLTSGKLTKLLEMREKGLRHLFWAMDPDAWFTQARYVVRTTSGLFTNWLLPFPKYDAEGKKADPNSLGRERCHDLLGQATLFESEVDLMRHSLEMLK